jgi:hypothetical protein
METLTNFIARHVEFGMMRDNHGSLDGGLLRLIFPSFESWCHIKGWNTDISKTLQSLCPGNGIGEVWNMSEYYLTHDVIS